MAPSIAKPLLWLGLLACGTAALAAPAPATRTLVSGDQPIKLDAASSEVDYKSNTVVFKDVVITQGEMRVQADRARATGLNFADSKWTFEGKVRIDAEGRGNLHSDSAVVEFKDNHLQKATVTGKPADFEQKRPGSDQIARGHANQIIYDVGDGTVRFSQDAWVSDGKTQISGPLLVYNIRGQKVQATTTPGTSERIRITIPAPAKDGANPSASGDADKPAPAPQP